MTFDDKRNREGEQQKRVTLHDIATLLNVSTATVSLALRDDPMISHTTKNRVRETAAHLGYSYNRNAAALRTARTHMIALTLHDIANPFFADLAASIEEVSSAQGLPLILGLSHADLGRQTKMLRMLREYRPDGMIVHPAPAASSASFEVFRATDIPLVQILDEVALSGFDFVGLDRQAGLRLIFTHLLEQGHRRIALAGGQDSSHAWQGFHDAWQSAHQDTGLSLDESYVLTGGLDEAFGCHALSMFQALAMPPTAIITLNDRIGSGLIKSMRHHGLAAGHDLSVVSCALDDRQQTQDGLSGLDNHHSQIAAHAVDTLTRRIAEPHRPASRSLIKPELVERGSIGRPLHS
jgi:LacI family transcriptional regulator